MMTRTFKLALIALVASVLPELISATYKDSDSGSSSKDSDSGGGSSSKDSDSGSGSSSKDSDSGSGSSSKDSDSDSSDPGCPGVDESCESDRCCKGSYCAHVDGHDICVDLGAQGDPHLVGFSGQKFDFTGQDMGHYALISEDTATLAAETVMTMLVHTPVPTLPEITYIVGLGLKASDLEGVEHEIEVKVDHPEQFYVPRSCPADTPACLADGALTITLDGEPMFAPGVAELGPGVSVGAVNIPGECRPFGFENYWAEKVRLSEEAATARAGGGERRLEVETMSMDDWVLSDRLATNPGECQEYVMQAVEDGTLFTYQSEHVSFQITTPEMSVRLNHGKLHQLAMRDPTDRFDLPDHRTFQMNIGLQRADLGEFPQGILGETTRPTFDEEGNMIVHGMSAIRGAEDDYRVSGPFESDFKIKQNRRFQASLE